ncbi:MAG: SDR family oxidoreductase [Chloroflexi bacterium]|nr:SDR family oxidoreductase [Chloroflexota bacterium]
MIADLTGRTALVTGGGQGVGRAIALVLAEQGADVAIGDVLLDHAERVVAEIEEAGRRAMALRLDVRSRAAANEAVATVVARWGALDILVNNAGVAHGPASPDGAVDRDADWDFVFDVNLRGIVHCCDAAMPHMAERRYGKIINISSTAGKPGDAPASATDDAGAARPPLGGSAYALSKAAVIRHTQLLAGSAARFNINVNCVCPSRMTTPMGLAIAARALRGRPDVTEAEVATARRQAAIQVNRFGRELEPVDVAKMVAFLASDDARNITGQSINVDGGFKMG